MASKQWATTRTTYYRGLEEDWLAQIEGKQSMLDIFGEDRLDDENVAYLSFHKGQLGTHARTAMNLT